MIDILKAFPLLFVLLILGPLAGGLIGAYLGFDNLAARLRNEQQADRIEMRAEKIGEDVGRLQIPINVIRRYEAQLTAAGQDRTVLQRILVQYEQLRAAIASREKFIGGPDQAERLASADHILRDMQAVLGSVQQLPGPGGAALIIKTAPNTFRVTFAVPMRVPPSLSFSNLPDGATGTVIEKTAIGFVVIFIPESIPVEHFGFAASAEL